MNLYNFTVSKNNNPISLDKFKNKVLLIVNVASKCGFTKQYAGLQKLYEEFSPQGLEILAFPCNQFGSQETGTNEEIQNFCTLNFGVSFEVFDKIDVNGVNAHPLYSYLQEQKPGLLGSKAIKWNFTKFLINRQGEIVKRIAPNTEPKKFKDSIAQLLQNS